MSSSSSRISKVSAIASYMSMIPARSFDAPRILHPVALGNYQPLGDNHLMIKRRDYRGGASTRRETGGPCSWLFTKPRDWFFSGSPASMRPIHSGLEKTGTSRSGSVDST